MRNQSSLGDVSYTSRGDIDNFGKITIGKVVKVYEKNNTVDVVLGTGHYMGDNDETDGRISCVKMEGFSGYDEDLNVAYGDTRPIAVGQMVIIAFVESEKGKPIIIGSLPPFDPTGRLNPRLDSKGELIDEKEERISVNRYQDYSYMNLLGEFEKVSNSRAFFVGKKNKMSDFRENAFNYENLTLKNKYTYDTIGLLENQFDFKPFNYLLTTRNQFNEKGAKITRLYHDAETGLTRFTQDTDNQVFYIQLDDEFLIQSNQDTNKRTPSPYDSHAYPYETLRTSDTEKLLEKDLRKPNTVGDEAEEYTSIKIDSKGNLILSQVNHGVKAEILLNKATGTVEITSKAGATNNHIYIGEKGINIDSSKPINISSSDTVNMSASNNVHVSSPNSISMHAPHVGGIGNER